MTHAKRKRRRSDITADELLSQLAADPEFMRRQNEKQAEHERFVQENRAAASPLLAELAGLGINVTSVGELHSRGLPYQGAIPLLMEWLPRIDNRDVKADIVRALSVRWARPAAARLLISEFRETTDASPIGIRWVIANALAVVADGSSLDDLLDLMTKTEHVQIRQMLVLALGNLEDPRSIPILVGLLADRDLAGHTVMALGTAGRPEHIPLIAPFLDDPRAWVRKEAKKAIRRLSRGRPVG